MEKCNKSVNELFICECHNTEHQLIFSYWPDELIDGQVFMSVHLVPEHNIFKRIRNAIKYIFGYRSRYGHFDEFVFNKCDTEKLQKVVNFLNKQR